MFIFLVVAVLLAVLSTTVQDDHAYRVTHECNGRLPMPTSAFVYAWTALVLGAVVVALSSWFVGTTARARKAGYAVRGGALAPPLLVLAVVAMFFEVFVLVVAFKEAVPIPGPCSG